MLNETIMTGLNNPDCAFYVGAFAGQMFVVRWLFFLLIVYVLLKAVDKLALEPLLKYLKIKFFGKQSMKTKK